MPETTLSDRRLPRLPGGVVRQRNRSSPDEEALLRNRWLVLRYGPIPSYGLWTPRSVGDDPAEWVAWWREVEIPPAVAPHSCR